MRKVLIAVALLMLTASTAFASDPILSFKRLSVAAGVDKLVAPAQPSPEDEWLGVLAVGYNVLSPDVENPHRPRVSLAGRVAQPFSVDQKPQFYVGVRVNLFNGGR